MNKFIKNVLITGLPFGLFMTAYFIFRYGTIGIISGVFAGLIFGIVMAIFTARQNRNFKKIKKEFSEDKSIIFDGPANHFKGIEAVGGWLFLTQNELIFKSHSFNIQKHKAIIKLKEIEEIKKTKFLGIVPTKIEIVKKEGTTDKFTINNRDIWVNKINKVRESI